MPTAENVLDGKATEKLVLDSDVPRNVVSFCEQCDRFFDIRSGCEEDIRTDERQKHNIPEAEGFEE